MTTLSGLTCGSQGDIVHIFGHIPHEVRRSFIRKRKETGSKSVPWGTPALTGARQELGRSHSQENRATYKAKSKETKKAVAGAKVTALAKIAKGPAHHRRAKERNKNAKETRIPDRSDQVGGWHSINRGQGGLDLLAGDDRILERWHDYFQKLMNEENSRVRRQGLVKVRNPTYWCCSH